MHTSMREARARIVRRDPRQVWLRHCCGRVRRHYRRAGQNARRDLRRACRRANDSQIVRDQTHVRRPMAEKLPAKTSPVPTPRAPPK